MEVGGKFNYCSRQKETLAYTYSSSPRTDAEASQVAIESHHTQQRRPVLDLVMESGTTSFQISCRTPLDPERTTIMQGRYSLKDPGVFWLSASFFLL